jgi:carboxyl-terminal processing protease
LLGQSNLDEKAAFGLVRGQSGSLLATYPAFEDFREHFEMPGNFWKQLSAQLPMPKHIGKGQEQHLRELVNNDGKAIVARLLYRRHVYFTEISNESNPSYRRAIRLLEQPDAYDTILRKR